MVVFSDESWLCSEIHDGRARRTKRREERHETQFFVKRHVPWIIFMAVYLIWSLSYATWPVNITLHKTHVLSYLKILRNPLFKPVNSWSHAATVCCFWIEWAAPSIVNIKRNSTITLDNINCLINTIFSIICMSVSAPSF